MRSRRLALDLLALSRAFAQFAPVVENNPIGTQYIAIFPDTTENTIRGAVAINTNSNGTGANVQVSISGLPATGGPFSKNLIVFAFPNTNADETSPAYHIHKCPVTGLNCTTASSHLDPYGATDKPPCDPSQPDKCEVGDLSGKHGNVNGPAFSAKWVSLTRSECDQACADSRIP